MVPISLSILAALAIVGLLGFEHYLPWAMLSGRELPRLPAYLLGVLAVVLPWSFWALAYPDATPLLSVLGLILAFVVGGLTVAGCWALDGLLQGREKGAVVDHFEHKVGRDNG